MPFVLWVAWRYGSRNRPATQEVQQRIAELTAEAEENVSGVRVVKAFAQEQRQLHRFRGAVKRVFDQSMVSTRLRAFYNPFIGFLPQLGLAALVLVGGSQVINGTITVGDFVAFYGYVVMLTSPMRTLGVMLGMAQRAVASGARVFEILDRGPELVAPSGAPALPAGGGRVELRGVTFGYDDGDEPVLRDIDLDVEAGQTVAVVGATGSGKTTLVLLVPRLYDVDQGAVLIDGADVRDVDLQSLRRDVALVSDDAFLFSATLRENIAYARADASEDEVREAAERAGLTELIEDLPDGFETLVGERGLTLSGGQRQRVAIARALLAAAAHPDPRRRHLERGRHHRGPDQGRAGRGDGGPHHVRDRPPPVHDLPGRRDRGARGGPHRRPGHPRRAAGGLRALPRDRRRLGADRGRPRSRGGRGGGPVRRRPQAQGRASCSRSARPTAGG